MNFPVEKGDWVFIPDLDTIGQIILDDSPYWCVEIYTLISHGLLGNEVQVSHAAIGKNRPLFYFLPDNMDYPLGSLA